MSRSRSIALPFVLTLGLLVAGCGGDTEEARAPATASVVVTDGWVRATTGTEDPSMTGAFMQLENQGSEPETLVGASAEVAGMVEIHQMVVKDGVLVMQRIEGGIEMGAGEFVVLEPGSDHVMLMGLEQELAPGDEVTLTLDFAEGPDQELTLPVKAFTEEQGHYHESPSTDGSTDPSPSQSESSGM